MNVDRRSTSSCDYSSTFDCKRKRDEEEKKKEPIDESPLKRRKKNIDKEADCGRTKYVTMEEFEAEFVSKLDTQWEYPERVEALQSYCSQQANHQDLYIYLGDRGIDIKLTIQTDPFKSQIFYEKTFREPSIKGKQSFHLIRLYENCKKKEQVEGIDESDTCTVIDEGPTKTTDERVLKIYSSILGSKAELSWVQKGLRLSGDDVLKFALKIQDMLRIKELVLFDDSKFKLRGTQRKVKLSLRKTMILTRSTVLSWYEERGFSLLECENFGVRKNSFTQDKTSYPEDVEFIRNTTLAKLKQTHKVKTLLSRLTRRYLDGKERGATIKTLMCAMKDRLRDRNEHKKKVAADDLNEFYAKVIDVYHNDNAIHTALRNIDGTRIFSRKI